MAANFLPPVVATLLADIGEYKAKLDEAKGEMGAFDEESKGMGAGTKAALLGLGTVIVGVGVEAVKLATTFDATMTRINTQDNANLTIQQMNNLKSSVLSLAGPVAQTPEALAEAMIHVYGSGLKGAQALEVLKIAGEGASVGNANLTDVVNALDSAIAVNIPGVQNYQQAMGELNATVGAGDMTMQNLADALGGPMLATVKGYGLNITDVGAALAVFGDRNIRGAEAATELRVATQALAVPAASGKKAVESLGLSMSSLRDDMEKGGLKLALNDLNDRLLKAGYNSKTAGAMITEMFGKKAGGGLNILLDSLSSSTSNFNDKFTQVAKTGQTFSSAWAQTQDTLAFKMRSLGDAVEALAVRLGNRLIPYVSDFLGWILKGSTWLGQHKAVLAVLAGLVGGALVSALYAAVAATIAWTAALDVNPVFLVITAIGALVGGLIYAYGHFSTFRNIVDDVGRFLKTVFVSAWHAVGDVIHWFVNGPLAFIKGILGDFQQFWKSHGQEIEEIAKVVWAFVSAYIVTSFKVTVDLLKGALGTLEQVWKFTWDLIKNIAKTTWDLIADTVRVAIKTTLDIIGIFLDLITGHWSKAWSDMKGLLHDAISGIEKIIGDFAHNALNLLYQAGKDIVNGLINGIKATFDSAKNVVSDLGNGIKDAFHSILSIHSPSRVFYQSGQYIVQGLIAGISAGHSAAALASSRLAAAVAGGFGAPNLSVSASGAAGGIGGANSGITVEVYLDGQKIQGAVRKQTLRYNQRNINNGLALAGRG